ncbi:hypothetical protein A3I27_00730 [Candidatus Giovannonibacteria bacterium RIFCSPLOWO2_02_FULL_43_11b]|uniref:Peptidase S1 domain-containing protein n=1 Tax=Candidatus Giovannonibacteria bacterium RIFCSPHIGHO2_12_FULL_43_15 TaxID=1798341 RepID=A0A1F5WPL0_9BACT|nr:MAG: hypothetical protein A3B97_01420 [Candidatus Giovannonibacteria bacterium RIFCSPHIGHO2_02_FULL_43_32]OGF77589.1 MAG: hypothetical protein A3F23_00080 [Candidatus Giovannonibacteria bacterium RIFCSPHIGHO2_12_FULL_43_15]OGF90178.1 MAG: hypothetical protein A3I27_00730 [Candidatus Giovannonibacteria bacterium RIFCSPLOWO2_02_FULL_43_11b]OGF92562.1 MAG: hypothetical protein A3H04_01920 [Candidatus Giovannonibacteria bacterium RIFCSPLOWO2_12_FULL_43_11c]
MKLNNCIVSLFLVLVPALANAEERCINPADYARSTVAITRYFKEGPASGTAWFYKDKKTLITAGHVARLLAKREKWTTLELQQRETHGFLVTKMRARIVKIGNIAEATYFEIAALEKYAKEDLAFIELEHPYPEALPLDISRERAPDYSPLWVIAYPSRKLVYEKGQTLSPGVETEYEKDFPSMIHIEIAGNRQSLIDGSSGSPTLNCAGKVSATISLFLNDEYVSSGGKLVRRATKGTATNYGLPSSFVEELEARK